METTKYKIRLKKGDTVSIIPSVAGGAPSVLSKEQRALPELSGPKAMKKLAGTVVF